MLSGTLLQLIRRVKDAVRFASVLWLMRSTLLSSSARCAREVLDVLDVLDVQDGSAQNLLKHKNDYLLFKCLKCNVKALDVQDSSAQKLLKHKNGYLIFK